MKKRKYLILTVIFSLFLPINIMNVSNETYSNEEIQISKIADKQPIHYEWMQIWNEGQDSHGYDLVMDDFNNVFVAVKSGDQPFLVKYNPSGLQLWNKSFPVVSKYSNLKIAIDSDGNLYMTGIVNYVGPTVSYIFLLKVNQTGDLQWYEEWGMLQSSYIASVGFNSNGDVFVLGNNFGADSITLLKYNKSGNLQWFKTWVMSSNFDRPFGMTIDSYDNIFIVGMVYDGYIDNTHRYDLFLIKLSSSGTQVFSTIWGEDSVTEIGYSIVLDSDNNIYVSGVSYITKPLANLILLKFDSFGNLLWDLKEFTTHDSVGYDIYNYNYIGNKIILDHSGNLIVSYIDYKNLAISNYSKDGHLITKYSDIKISKYGQLSPYIYICESILIDPLDNVYITGFIANPASMFLMKCNSGFGLIKDPDIVFSDEKIYFKSFITYMELHENIYFDDVHHVYTTFRIDGYNEYFLIYVYYKTITSYIRMDIRGDGEYSFEVEPYTPYNFTYNNARRYRAYFNYSYTYESCTSWSGVFCTGDSLRTESGEFLSNYFSIPPEPPKSSIPGYEYFLIISALSVALVVMKEKIKIYFGENKQSS